MEPLVCVVPQSLRVLVERLPAYISFLQSQGYGVYRQTSTRLTATQARVLYGRTQDELFSLHTPVAVLLLEREEPYAAWQAVRDQLDIVYGSPDRKTAMDDIYAFFSGDDEETQPTADTQPTTTPVQPAPPAVPAPPAAKASSPTHAAPPPPPPPPSGPPPFQSDDEADEAMDGAFLLSAPSKPAAHARAEPTPPSPPPPPPPFMPPPPPPPHTDETSSEQRAAEKSAVPPPPPPPPSQFQWEEIEADTALVEASPRPSSPSDSPVAFHAAPDSPHTPLSQHDEVPEDDSDSSEQRTWTNGAALPAVPPPPPVAAPPAPTAPAVVAPAAVSEVSAPLPPPVSAAVSPLQSMSETKRGSLDSFAAAGTASSSKGLQDLLAMPARLSIKERLRALNLTQEPAPANNNYNDATHSGEASNTSSTIAAGSAAPTGSVSADERRASASMQQKQATLTTLFAKRLSLEKTPVNGSRAMAPPSAVVCPFASIAALAPNGPFPARSSHSPLAFEYTQNLPSSAVLLAASKTMRGVIHHMTGDEDEWGQRFALLHLDSLYIWPNTEQQRDEPQLMICVSEPTVSLAYAEGVIEVKGSAAGGRHLMAAELPDIERWYDELTRAKIEMASEDKRKTDEANGNSRRSSLTNPLAIALKGQQDSSGSSNGQTHNGGGNGSLQSQIRQMRHANNAAGVSAVRQPNQQQREEDRLEEASGEERYRDAVDYNSVSVSGTAAASLHRTLQPPPPSMAGIGGTIGALGAAQLDDSGYLRSLLLHGALFTKYKYKRGKQRWIWCSPELDTLYWSEEKGRKVKGQLSTLSITGVADGCVGVKRKGVGLTIVAEDRTLDLEARDEEQQKDWLRAIGLLINSNRQ